MNINTSSGSYSTRASTNKGMSGMISGMDTEGMVDSMLSGIQAKIDKQNADKQQTIWRQEGYRGIITSINDFRMKFFDFSSSSNLKSNSFFNNMVANSKANAFKITANSTAAAGRTSVVVNKLASATSAKSSEDVSGILSGDFDAKALSKEVVFTIDTMDAQGLPNGTQDVTVNLNGAKTDAETQARLEAAFQRTGVTATVKDGAMKIVANGKTQEVRVSSKSTALGLEALGMSVGAKTFRTAENVKGNPDKPEEVTGQTISYQLGGTVKLDSKVTLEVTLDNITKTLTLDPNEMTFGADGKVDQGKFLSQLQTQLHKFGNNQDGTPAIAASIDGTGKLTLAVSKGRQIFVGGNDYNSLKALGMKQDQSNKLSAMHKLKDLNFKTELQGTLYKFKINEQEFTFSENDTLSSVMSKINSSDAGVRLTYLPNEDRFSMEATDSGAGQNITMSQTEGNLLSALFGGDVAQSATSNELVKNIIQKTEYAGADGIKLDTSTLKAKSGVFAITVDGRKYSISVPQQYQTNADGSYIINDKDGNPVTDPAALNKDGTLKEGQSYAKKEYTQAEIRELVNEGLQNQFGYTADGKQAIALTASGMEINNGAKVSFDKLGDNLNPGGIVDIGLVTKAIEGGDLTLMFGLSDKEPKDNSVDETTLLSEVGLTGTGTLGNLAGYDKATDRVTVTTNLDEASMQKLFGVKSMTFGNGATTAKVEAGVNAEVVINGVATERSSNSFTIDGLNFELLEVSKKDDKGSAIAETIDTTRDTSKIFDGIKSFVDDYNKLIEGLNKLVDEDATYKEYAPLTAAQKSQMSESEVKAWEAKAQTGLLRNDSTINLFLTGMRSGFYQKPEGAKYALYDIGISTTTYENKGKLVIDENVLKQMIENEPTEIQKLFNGDGTGTGKGLMNTLEETIQSIASTSSGSPGLLVSLAGTKATALSSQNTLSNRITNINERIKTLQRTYESQKARYWKQFNTMEQALSNMSSQSAFLNQQFGG